jgi:diguanylate cyclase (GGDEF)-like protein
MPQFITPASPADTIAALGEALDLIDVGVAVLDRDLHTRIVNRRFAELWALAGSPVLTVQELAGMVSSFAAPGSAADPAEAADRLEAAMRAGAIPTAEIRLADGTRRLLQCMVRRDGGRVLTCTDPAALEEEAIESQQAHAATERLASELRFSNETLESQAAYLASLAEAADANAQAAEDAKRLLEREVAERRELEAQLRRMATTDALTGSLNRAQLLAVGQREVDRVREHGLNLAMLMLDIDHFKSINDRYGHAAGDAALCHLVAALRTGIRRVDLLGRLGGEEFGIVLPAIGTDTAALVAERLRAYVAGHPLLHGAQQIGMTISIGVAMLRDSDHTAEQLLARADALLYAAKDAGRNRVVCEAGAIAA